MTVQPACQVHELNKVFRVGFLARRVVACRNITFTIRRGEVFGLVGPNGAGKSTTLKMLLGFVRPDSGHGEVLGLPLGHRESRARLGYLPELPSFPRYLTAEEVLDFHARLAGVDARDWTTRRGALLERVGLSKARGVRLSTYSKGMLQRCGLAVALCSNPELLVLDEPMSGLDPLGRHDVRTLITEAKAAGKTILFSSHVLSDVEALCDSVAIISAGSVFKSGPLLEVTGGTVQTVEVTLESVQPQQVDRLVQLGKVREQDGTHILELKEPDTLDALLQQAVQNQWKVKSVIPLRQNLEDVLLKAQASADHTGRTA